MFKVQVIGNLGADAQIMANNGRQFVSFRVAHSEKYTSNGQQVEETTWVSCALNGDGGKLLPYLKQGAKVFVEGRARLRVYSSKQDRCMKAGLSIMVDNVELCGGSSDAVPKQLYDRSGVAHNVYKYFWTQIPEEAKEAVGGVLLDADMKVYSIDANGFITATNQTSITNEQQQQAAATPEANQDGDSGSDVVVF